MNKIESNYLRIKKELSEIRKPIKLCCVTKYSNSEDINLVIRLGAEIIGENKVQDAIKKFEFLDKVEKHFIGHLQSNKIKKAVELFDVIQTIDSIELAEKINQICRKKIMIQVNIGREPQKYGFLEEDLDNAIEEISKMKNLEVLGLMTILPKYIEKIKKVELFKKMRNLNDKYKFTELSMGMTGDYELAIKEGATIVRIGSAIFK